MQRRISGMFLPLLMTCLLALAFNAQPIKAESGTTIDLTSVSSWQTIETELQNEWQAECEELGYISLPGTLDFCSQEGVQSFASSNDTSVEFVLGVDVPGTDVQGLEDEIAMAGGEVTDMISAGETVRAIIVRVLTEETYAFAETLRANAFVKYVEPSSKVEAFYVPNDPGWSQQWGPKKIEADWAWNTTIGSSDILVAIVDTGIDYTHADLAANYVPLGYDWVNIDSNPIDDNGHGTHCAGIVAAEIDNNIGIAGIAQVRIMAEKVLDGSGYGYDTQVAQGIYHATDAGADVISMSLGGDTYSSVLHEAAKYAYEHGVLLVASAGNNANDEEEYPAAYPEVIAVTATDSSDNLAYFSTYGDWVELSAPGVSIYSTVLSNSYASWSGTSMACPHISGVAALIWSRCLGLTNTGVWYILEQTADDLGDYGFDQYFGYGRVNARKAIAALPERDLSVIKWQYPHRIIPGQTGIFNATIANYALTNETDVIVQFLVNGTLAEVKIIDFLNSGSSIFVSFSWSSAILGNYNFTCYVVPVPMESVTENNMVSSMVKVRYPIILRVPEEYPTIKIALNNAACGDTILVSEGHYVEGQVDIVEDGVVLVASGHVVLDGWGTKYVLNINAEDVVVEGFEIRNGSSYGVNMQGYNITLTKNYINNNTDGIHLYKSKNSTISMNKVTTMVNTFPLRIYTGCIIVERSSNCTINSNSIQGGALFLQFSTSNVLLANNITDGNFGLVMLFSTYNTLRNNIMSNNSRNFCVLKSDPLDPAWLILRRPEQVINDIDASNTVNGKPIYYWIGEHNKAIPLDAGCVVLVNCENITVQDLDLRNNLDGVFLLNSNGTLISRNVIAANSGQPWENYCGGITVFFGSSNNIITQNNLISNEAGVDIHSALWEAGKYIGQGYNYTISHNNITRNTKGLMVWGITNCLTSLNNLTNNWDSAYFYGTNHVIISNNFTGSRNGGVRVIGPNHVIISNNFLSGNIGLELDYVANSIVVSNNISNTRYHPLHLTAASNNKIFYNNIINHGMQVIIHESRPNTWDDGYPSGGNHWSRYSGNDTKSGPNQNMPGSDGIGDTPYVLDINNRDRYPLMNPCARYPALQTQIQPTSASIVVGQSVNFTSTTIGLFPPYGYQWYLNGTPVSGATLTTWTFTPITAGTYTICLNVTDRIGIICVSNEASITVKPQLKVAISPTSTSLRLFPSQSVIFTSTVSGGYTPYSCQWYLYGNPVLGATSSSWTFTPTWTDRIYYVYLKVTDNNGNKAQSETARIDVTAIPVGGYSFPVKGSVEGSTKGDSLTQYLTLVIILATIFTATRRKNSDKKQKHLQDLFRSPTR